MTESILLQIFEILGAKMENFGSKVLYDKVNMVCSCKQMLSFVIVVPDSPDEEQFKLLKTLQKNIFIEEFSNKDKKYYFELITAIMQYYTTQVSFIKI